LGSAVSEAATSTAHAGKQAAQDASFSNLGQAVSSAVHEAQQAARDGEAAAEDSEVGSSDGTTTSTSTRPQ
jgi:hypothetical protein